LPWGKDKVDVRIVGFHGFGLKQSCHRMTTLHGVETVLHDLRLHVQ
jgi:hypothetical protein